ncbi:zf-HC2 domain-containing protein [Treponema sp.]|uniref:anti-sigma factor family protein n=1 Tax=Treponema sp. TaxID=166 RepID=UPI00298EB1A1|nr:zf-HC2 domain-containing protein [Treponema sp.]MCQ2240662.1 zf-HC2 domain-containing protein [Treponema sp.]
MSTCPENDIHSLYLDGELPEKFMAEYEAHVASCPKCSAKLEKLTELQGFIHEDSNSYVFSQKQLDDSFARLQAKMSYSNFKKEEKRSSNVFTFPKFKGLQYFAAGIAAAAAVAFVIPRGKTSASVAAQKEFSPLARSVSKSAVNPVIIDNNIDAVQLASFLGSEDSVPSIIAVPSGDNVSVQKMILDDCGAYGTSSVVKPALADYDVFSPIDTADQKEHEADHTKGFSFSVSSPFLKVSFQVGK